jgi:hypothetical protein
MAVIWIDDVNVKVIAAFNAAILNDCCHPALNHSRSILRLHPDHSNLNVLFSPIYIVVSE